MRKKRVLPLNHETEFLKSYYFSALKKMGYVFNDIEVDEVVSNSHVPQFSLVGTVRYYRLRYVGSDLSLRIAANDVTTAVEEMDTLYDGSLVVGCAGDWTAGVGALSVDLVTKAGAGSTLSCNVFAKDIVADNSFDNLNRYYNRCYFSNISVSVTDKGAANLTQAISVNFVGYRIQLK